MFDNMLWSRVHHVDRCECTHCSASRPLLPFVLFVSLSSYPIWLIRDVRRASQRRWARRARLPLA